MGMCRVNSMDAWRGNTHLSGHETGLHGSCTHLHDNIKRASTHDRLSSLPIKACLVPWQVAKHLCVSIAFIPNKSRVTVTLSHNSCSRSASGHSTCEESHYTDSFARRPTQIPCRAM